MKKKLVAVLMAGVMVMGMSMTVLAAETPATEPGFHETTITGEVAENYSISIPATINEDVVLKISGAGKIAPKNKVEVKIDKNSIKMARHDQSNIPATELDVTNSYDITLKDVTTDVAVLTISDTNAADEVTIEKEYTKGADLKAGTYSGKVTFVIAHLPL